MTSNSDDVALVRAGRVERGTEKLAELRHRWLRGIGYVARPLVFLLAIGAWVVFWYVWLARADIFRRPIGSLTLKQIIEPFVWFILCPSPGGGPLHQHRGRHH